MKGQARAVLSSRGARPRVHQEAMAPAVGLERQQTSMLQLAGTHCLEGLF